jgi:glycosyltransferase involved in cell wall biosynthesis
MGTRGIPASYGGFETFAEELSTRLVRRGHRVTVYGRSHYVRHREGAYRGVELAVLPAIRHKYLETVSHALFSCLHGLFKGYDAVLMCNAANSLVCLIPRLGGSGVLINVDGLEWQRKKWNILGRGWYRLGERAATLFPHRIISDARVIQEYYRRRHGVDSIYIPYGAPHRKEPGREALRSLGLKTDGYFLYVSRLEPENNAHLVIQAYSRVKTDKPLVVVGGAPYNQPYVESLKAMADPRVRFTGFIFGRAYRQLQSGCFAYVHATEVGGTHPALIEGMGMANAVIANDTPENREAAGDGALLYRRNDPGSLAEAMEDLLRNPGSRKGLRKRALKQVRSRYDWNRIADAYEKAFHDIIGDG